jgi:hypothetical protein
LPTRPGAREAGPAYGRGKGPSGRGGVGQAGRWWEAITKAGNVDSDATVKLITKTLSTMAADKTIGRSEALRRSMVALIEQGALDEAHPAYWAPFVVVGEGSVGGIAPSPLTTSSIIPDPQPPTKASPSAARPRPSKRVTTPDWRSEVWRR